MAWFQGVNLKIIPSIYIDLEKRTVVKNKKRTWTEKLHCFFISKGFCSPGPWFLNTKTYLWGKKDAQQNDNQIYLWAESRFGQSETVHNASQHILVTVDVVRELSISEYLVECEGKGSLRYLQM